MSTEHALGVGSVQDVDAYLAAHSEDPELASILRGPRSEKLARFGRFATERRAFSPISAAGGNLALAIVRDEAARVLAGSAFAARLGALVRRVDELFLTSEHYPSALRDLWHAFDWCDETWTLDNQPGLRKIIEGFLQGEPPRA